MNKQQIFDKIVAGLASQGFKQSVDMSDGGMCVYRGPDGLKCAVGWLIPDEEYSKGLEGYSVENNTVAKAAGLKGSAQWEFTARIQEIHDNYDHPEVMKGLLRDFAIREKLKIPEELSVI